MKGFLTKGSKRADTDTDEDDWYLSSLPTDPVSSFIFSARESFNYSPSPCQIILSLKDGELNRFLTDDHSEKSPSPSLLSDSPRSGRSFRVRSQPNSPRSVRIPSCLISSFLAYPLSALEYVGPSRAHCKSEVFHLTLPIQRHRRRSHRRPCRSQEAQEKSVCSTRADLSERAELEYTISVPSGWSPRAGQRSH